MDFICVNREDHLRAEKNDYKFLHEEVLPYLKWIKGPDFPITLKGFYVLNAKGRKKYPPIADQKFNINQVQDFVFTTGINPFEWAISKILYNK